MSSRSRNSNYSNKDNEHLAGFKTCSFTYQTEKDDLLDDYLFEEDEYPQSRYLEKEIALKKINDELEKKTSEIFKKIERYRSNDESDSNKTTADEVGQGDARLSFENLASKRFLSSETFELPNSSFNQPSSPSPLRFTGSYFNLSRASSSEADVGNNISSSGTSRSSCSSRRPATAGAVGLHCSSPTESSLRRAETARPIEGIEEKHQIRLQKATESVLKCVQSKLVNYEHRLADMHLQYRQKIQENTMLESKVKAMDEDRKRLLKSVQSLQSTTDKYSKSAENSKMNLNLKLQAFASLKKEMDTLKRDLKHKSGMIQSLQTRLDRCTEENRRLKSQHQSTQLNLKQQQNEERSAMEDLRQRVIQLEQQKVSYQSTVEKQAQLIKNLRNQKVSLTSILQKNKIKVENCSDLVNNDDVDDDGSSTVNVNLEV